MSRICAAIATIAALVVAGIGVAMMASPVQASQGVTTVVGGGTLGISYTFGYFQISARSGPEGDSGRAYVRYFGPDWEQWTELDIKCVNVVENTAFVTGVIVDSYREDYIGMLAGFLLKDEGTSSEAPVDGFTGTSFSSQDPATACHLAQGPFFSFTNVRTGNIVINRPQ